MNRGIAATLLGILVLLGPAAGLAPNLARADVPRVEPEDLTQPQWLGREVVVEDRVRVVRASAESQFDQVHLQRTPVVFRLPPSLSFPRPPDLAAARLQGVLRRQGDRLIVNVTSMTALPEDLKRVTDAVAALPPGDFQRRQAWARWAEHRAQVFDDEPLREAARTLYGEALWIEAQRTAHNRPEVWLDLAEQARHRGAAVRAAAMAHQGVRLRLEQAASTAELDELLTWVEAFFPDTQRAPRLDLAGLENAYVQDPAGTYVQASDEHRQALDRRLVGDVIQTTLERRLDAQPEQALALTSQAKEQLPDRPEVAERFLQQGLAQRDPAQLRKEELDAWVAALHAEDQPEAAQDLQRRYLDAQVRKLSPTNAEGRVLLAQQYWNLLEDRTRAVELLKQALRIDPQASQATTMLRRLGLRPVGDTWVEGSSSSPAAPSDRTPGAEQDSLLGQTPDQVQAALGQPDRVVRAATQGRVVEQWIYRSARGTQYVNFLKRRGSPHATVTAHYSYTER